MTRFDLTEEQQAILKPLFDKVRQASADGEPGMIVAQVFFDWARAEFFPSKIAILREAMDFRSGDGKRHGYYD